MHIAGKVERFTYICFVKSNLRHTVTLFLTLCILLGSVGIAFSEQLCQMTGLKPSAATEQTVGCCKSSDSGTAGEDDCCDVQVSFEKLDPVSSLKGFHLEAPAFFSSPWKPLLLPEWALAATTEKRILTYSDSSPPLYGRSLLQRIHILNI